MTKRQAQNVARAIGGKAGLPEIRETRGGWEVVVPMHKWVEGEDIPRSVTLREGGIYLHFGEAGNVTNTQAVCWPTDPPQSLEEEEFEDY